MQLPFREWTLFCGISLGGGRNASARSGIPERLDKLEISDSVKKVSFCYSVGECSGFVSRVAVQSGAFPTQRSLRDGKSFCGTSPGNDCAGGHKASARHGSQKE